MNHLRLLGLSDLEVPAVYSHRIRERFPGLDAVISCGDLPAYYLEYVISMLNTPLYYVQGNHVFEIPDWEGTGRIHPEGAVNLHRKVVYDAQLDLILAGVEGSLLYNNGPFQYSQAQMWQMVLSLVPQLLLNKVRYGRYLDIFVTHAAPAGIHDQNDPAHRGVEAFLWLIETFSPKLHLHGHIHLYNPLTTRDTQHQSTRVINCYGHRLITLSTDQAQSKA